MKITTKGRYGLCLMVDLAENYGVKRVSLKNIADRHEISFKYLEQIIRELSQKNLVESVRGRDGGYILTRRPGEYTVKEIVEVCEGSSTFSKGEGCGRSNFVWSEVNSIVVDYLESVTLESIVEKNKKK